MIFLYIAVYLIIGVIITLIADFLFDVLHPDDYFITGVFVAFWPLSSIPILLCIIGATVNGALRWFFNGKD